MISCSSVHIEVWESTPLHSQGQKAVFASSFRGNLSSPKKCNLVKPTTHRRKFNFPIFVRWMILMLLSKSKENKEETSIQICTGKQEMFANLQIFHALKYLWKAAWGIWKSFLLYIKVHWKEKGNFRIFSLMLGTLLYYICTMGNK